MNSSVVVLVSIGAFLAGVPHPGHAESPTLTMSTTTSTQSSGLLDVLLPVFEKETGIKVKVIAKGTGAAIRDGMDGNADILFVHARAREEAFVAEGYGAYRLDVMHNDFVILGPRTDPAGIRGMADAPLALKKIAEAKASFVSRGDDSGTHTKEQDLWKETGLIREEGSGEVAKGATKKKVSFVQPKQGAGSWYLSIGQGMGKALTFAEEKQAYTLADRGTYLNYRYGRSEGLDLDILVEGDSRLNNPYGIIPVSPKKQPHVKFDLADRFAKWLTGPEAQTLIADYKIQGFQAFFPDAVSAQ